MRTPPAATSAHPTPPAPRRTALRLVAHALAVALTAGLLAIATLAADARPAYAAGPSTAGRFYIQNSFSGYNISATDDLLRTSRPKGDEDNQQWTFERVAGSANYRVRNATLTDLCMGRSTGRPVVLGCSGTDTEWEFRHQAGEWYKIFVPGTETRLQGRPAGDDPAELDLSTRQETDESWYVTPIDPPRSPMPADPTFDQMTFLTAHNAYNNTEDAPGAMAPNQPHSIRRQLDDGVRALMLDIHAPPDLPGGQVILCHGSCGLTRLLPLTDVLNTVADWMRAHPREVVTVFFEDYTTSAQLKNAMDQVPGLAGLIYNPRTEGVREKGWPKVSQMADSGKRLVLFSDKDGREGFGVMHGYDWTAENYWSMGPGLGSSDWSCYSRWSQIPLGKEEEKFRRLVVMNHFRDVPMAPTYETDNEKLRNRAERFCMPAARKKPNFLAVDQYKDGDPLSAVQAMNGYVYHGDTPGWGGTPAHWSVPRLAVMPLGDSITWGAGGTGYNSYRAQLWDKLAGHASTVDFVGSLKDGTLLPDRDHEGHSGWKIGQLTANIDTWLAAAKPNVVLLHIGTNDMNRDDRVDSAPQRLAELVDRIGTASPATTVLVASLVPSSDPVVQARVSAYNAQVPRVVEEQKAKGRKVEFVSMAAVTTADLNDRLHPNDSGYSKMAQAFYSGVERVAKAGLISENVVVKPAPPRTTPFADYDVDIDGDSRADYLVVEDDGAVRAWLNRGGDGYGGWIDYGRIATGTGPGSRVCFADVDGDGRADYLVVGEDGSVGAWANKGGDGHGGWSELGRIAAGGDWSGDQVRFGDVDADGRADYLVVEDNGAVRAFLNRGGDGHGGWEKLGQIATGSDWSGDQVRFGDVDADGRADYLVVEDNGAVRAFLNRGGDGHGG
ncbi:FG-GAP-like repeat-containing protein, partial [Streptomyces somaliensis]|uniref:FG-GAP-like repeat-containing protein n=1 Tax=Streptomyces somaliensis TaxID=78355 RepID=UPI00263A856C